jgi:hypothetical protein
LPHGLNRSGGIPEPDGLALVDGSVDGGGVARDGAGEVGVMVVRGASGPWVGPVDRRRSVPSVGSTVL